MSRLDKTLVGSVLQGIQDTTSKTSNSLPNVAVVGYFSFFFNWQMQVIVQNGVHDVQKGMREVIELVDGNLYPYM